MAATILRGVDRAAFAVALGVKLRAAGVPVGTTAIGTLVRALQLSPPTTRDRLYWAARISLVRSPAELAAFDALFGAAFEEALTTLDPVVRRSGPTRSADTGAPTDVPGPDDGLPWATLPKGVSESTDPGSPVVAPLRLPSHLDELADEPFERLSRAETEELGAWLARALPGWPARPGRRWTPDRSGSRIILRATLAQARRTGWEPVRLVTGRRRPTPRRVVLLCDVSRSMQAHATAYLYLMRALARATHAETFAFATRLTRLSVALRHRSPEAALTAAADLVTDRFGGTRIATNVDALLASRHGDQVRGAVVIVGSDGWDGDPPEHLARAMERLRRRAHRVVWMNPRAAAPGFEPTVATMAAALPFCDAFLPAATFRGLAGVLEAISSTGSRGSTAGTGRASPRSRAASPGSPSGW